MNVKEEIREQLMHLGCSEDSINEALSYEHVQKLSGLENFSGFVTVDDVNIYACWCPTCESIQLTTRCACMCGSCKKCGYRWICNAPEIKSQDFKIPQFLATEKPDTLTPISAPAAEILTTEYARGWECPRCGKIHAPWVPECNCTKPWKATFSATSTGPSEGDMLLRDPISGRGYWGKLGWIEGRRCDWQGDNEDNG